MFKTMELSQDQVNAMIASKRTGSLAKIATELAETIKSSKVKYFALESSAVFGNDRQHVQTLYTLRKMAELSGLADLSYDKTTLEGKYFKRLVIVKK